MTSGGNSFNYFPQNQLTKFSACRLNKQVRSVAKPGSSCRGTFEGWSMGRGVPSQWGKGLGRGMCPLRRKLSNFLCENDVFCAFLALFLVAE